MAQRQTLVILIAVDGSPAALAAVRHAIELARRGLVLRCVAVNVQPPPTLYEVVLAHERERLDDVRAAAGSDLLAPALALLAEAGIAHDHDVVGGEPAAALAEVAEACGADLLLIGARGDGSSAHALGRTALAVLEHARVPVTVVRGPEADTDTDPA
jgi:nucleotide-binding universal stress UspA family protein